MLWSVCIVNNEVSWGWVNPLNVPPEAGCTKSVLVVHRSQGNVCDMGEWVTPAEPAGATSGLKGSKSRSNNVSSFFTSGASFCEGVVTLISGTKLSSKKLMMFSCWSSFVGVTLGRGGTGGPFLVCEGDLGLAGAGDAGVSV